MMGSPHACPECARRGLLLAALAGHIDRSVSGRSGSRARDLLALSDAQVAAAVAPADAGGQLRRVRSRAADPGFGSWLESAGCWSSCAHSGGVPSSLASLGTSAPRALYGVGNRSLLSELGAERSVTIVGSRRSTPYGREVAHELGRLLAASGVTVISGMALGIDSAAHEGALAAGGRTVAVLGPGAERPYPRSGGNLYGRIRARGLVISELPPGSPTFRWMFPARNRLMAAMAVVTVVVEAAERSGSLITAEMAIEGGRQVGAVPGPVTAWSSSGTNKLLSEGAAVVRDAQDVVDLLFGPGVARVASVGPPISPAGQAALASIEGGAITVDAVATEAAVSFSEALVLLAGLERDGYVQVGPTGRYSRTAQEQPEPLIRG
jgi:DNA processing protein